VPHVEVLQGGYDVENTPASKRPAAYRSDNVRGSFRNDIRLDGKWKHQRLCEGAPGCEPVKPGKFFIRNLTVFASGSLTIG
jgi:hypothetical protein